MKELNLIENRYDGKIWHITTKDKNGFERYYRIYPEDIFKFTIIPWSKNLYGATIEFYNIDDRIELGYFNSKEEVESILKQIKE